MSRSPELKPEVLAATLHGQDGVLARCQMTSCGVTSEALRHRLRPGGPWQRLLPGIYLTVTGTATVRQKEMAALLYAGTGSVITGLAALRSQGIGGSAPAAVIDVLVPASRQRKSAAFVALHRTRRMPETVVAAGRRQYAMPPRALADAALWIAELREARALIAGVVQQGRCPVGMLARELKLGPIRDSAVLRQVLAEVLQGVRSVTEAEFLDLIKHSRLAMPLFNASLYDPGGTFLAIADAWWPAAGVAAEVDSRQWHLNPADWERTMRRHAQMSRHGIIVLHFTPGQIRSEPAAVIAALSDALKAGLARPPLAVTARPAS